ncbi:pentatricopeptide repeat-containing protein At2g22070 [Aristolochia californica]|uniref:pentatricopeptide repeat-containing protein At2g22070 n=1 Tax=Aristolochia californica TaxID=171875 RepID=UPI0035E16C72
MNKLTSRPFQLSLKLCVERNHEESIKSIQSLPLACPTICSVVSSNRLLRALSKWGRIDVARQMFDKMSQRDEFSWSTMISGYARWGRLVEAHQLFEQTPNRISVTWSSLISGYAHYGLPDKVLELFWQMQLEGLKPDEYTLGSVLCACSNFSLLQRGKQVHCCAIKTSCDSNIYVVTGLVDMYAKCMQISDASYLFDRISEGKNHVLWTAIVSGYCQNGDGIASIRYFCNMWIEGVGPNQFTFPSVLTACAIALAHGFGMQVHGCIVRTGFSGNVFVDSALIYMYAKCGDLESAKNVLELTETEDVVSWNCLIVGCVRQGNWNEALSLFRKMYVKGMKIDGFTYPSVLNSLASLKDIKIAKCVHGLIVRTGFEEYKHVSNALIDMYAKHGMLECAFGVFDNMCEPDVISWTSLIGGYTHCGSHEKALNLFCQMRKMGIGLDEFAISGILSACAGLTVLDFGRQVHVILIKIGFVSSLSVDNSLMTMYAKCGSIEDAHRAFDLMPVRDIVSWTALIVSYARNGRGEVSLQLYDEMLKSGIRPDSVTFIGLLFACSHAGLVAEAKYHFESMSKVYGVSPEAEHYACLIDGLGRAGKVCEAGKLLNQMIVEADPTVWKALLAACRVHGNITLGEKAAWSLFKLEPQNAVPYVLLSNMYSAAGRWDDAAKIRSLMKSRGVTKEAGYSWIEVNGIVHTFMVEDGSHPRAIDIYSKIDEIISMIKEAGYVPDTNYALHDVDEEVKELGLAYHSEKLAVAFGLITLPQGAPIRIFKNLRVCGDCHCAIKFVSKVFKRHIILRDSNCFHHFREGTCSCRDYW